MGGGLLARPSKMAFDLVMGDGKYPSPEILVFPEGGEVLKSVKDGFLINVVGIGREIQGFMDEIIEPQLDGLDQPPKCRL